MAKKTFLLEKTNKGFTLIELLIVIVIIAILSIVVVLTLSPNEMLRQARDATRLSDMDTMNRALGLYVTDMATQGTSLNLGNASTVYVSLIDSSSTCGSLGLPALPAGYTYHCGSATSSRNTDSSGWLPVNLKNISSGSPLGSLPIDPVNQSSTNLYYTYVVNGTQWEFAAYPESQKQRTNLQQNPMVQNQPGIWAIGSNINLLSNIYSITGVTMNLSILNGYAFIDNSSLSLSSYIGKYITVSDGNNSISGYINAQGTGETYSSQLTTNWNMETGNPPTGWTAYQGNPVLAQSTDVPTGIGSTYSLEISPGTPWYGVHIPATLIIGALNYYDFYEKNVGGGAVYAGQVFGNWDLTYGAQNASWTHITEYKTVIGNSPGLETAAGNIWIDNFSIEQVLTPSSAGVTIVSTKGGGTQNWTLNTGINVNAANFKIIISP